MGRGCCCCRAPAACGFVRVIAVVLLLGFAAWVYLGNYDLLFNSHAFMTGADYVDEKVTLPLRWLLIVGDSGGAAAGLVVAIQAGGRSGGRFFCRAIGGAGHRSRRLCAAE